MPSAETLAVFATATILLIAVPGPATLYILGRGIAAGRNAALISALGIETASAVFVLLTAFGLSAVLAASELAFTVVRLCGVAYLFFLAARAVWPGRRGGDIESATPAGLLSAFRRGFLVGISNPKVAVFFLAFFPQFVDPSAPAAPQILVLGAVFVALGLAADALNACAAAAVGAWLARRPRFLERRRFVEAGVYAALGSWTLATGGGGDRG